MSDPLIEVSVILPTYNRCDILSRTLGLYGQQRDMVGRFEVIVADDGSSDDTMKMLHGEQATSKFPLSFVTLAGNSGPSAARNKAISMARGKILLFSGDDILPSPRLVAEHHEWHVQRHPDRHIGVIGHVQWAPELGVTPFMRWLERSGAQFAYGQMKHGERVDAGLAHTANISIKADFLKSTGEFFDERLRFHEDSEWALRLKNHGFELRYNALALSDHLHPVDLDASLSRMRAVGGSLVNLKLINPENFDRVTSGIFKQPSTMSKQALLLLIDPVIGRIFYAPLSRLFQKHFAIDKLFAACHASYLLDGLREELALSPKSASGKREASK